MVSCNSAYRSVTFTKVDNDIFAEDAPQVKLIKTQFFYGNDFEYAVWSFSNILTEGLKDKQKQTQIENERQQSIAKLAIIKSHFAELTKFPDSINAGWHKIIATDNSNFCKEAKVLIKDNKISKFVIDNFVSMNFSQMGEIKKAKALITSRNFNGEQLNLLEIYFLYDLDQQNIVEPPITPGYICFWTNIDSYASTQIKLENMMLGNFQQWVDYEPQCFGGGAICRILKPGFYMLDAKGKGHLHWQGGVEVKAGYCTKVKLGKGSH